MYKYKSLQAGELPLEQLSFLQNFLDFIITKYLQQNLATEALVWSNVHVAPVGFL